MRWMAFWSTVPAAMRHRCADGSCTVATPRRQRGRFLLLRANAYVSRRGHHDAAVRGCDVVASLTTFEKARERNDFGRCAERHTHSCSVGLDEGLKRGRGKYHRKAAGAQESEPVQCTLLRAPPQGPCTPPQRMGASESPTTRGRRFVGSDRVRRSRMLRPSCTRILREPYGQRSGRRH